MAGGTSVGIRLSRVYEIRPDDGARQASAQGAACNMMSVSREDFYWKQLKLDKYSRVESQGGPHVTRRDSEYFPTHRSTSNQVFKYNLRTFIE